MSIKSMTIAELVREGVSSPKPIYILNTSAESAAKRGGNIYLSIPKRNGADKDPLRIRHTWLPQALTDHVTRAQLLNSSEFRALVNKKLVTPISEKSALELLASPDAEDEMRNLEAEDRNIEEAGGGRSITADVKVIGGEGDVDHSSEEDIPVSLITSINAGDEVDLPAGISEEFGAFVERAAEMGDAQAANAVRNYQSRYTRAELRFIKEKLKNSPKVVAMATKSLTAVGTR